MPTKKQEKKSKTSRRRLGRGLTSLLSAPVEIEVKPDPAPSHPAEIIQKTPASHPPTHLNTSPELIAHRIPLKDIQARSGQPRQFFNEDALNQLADSIRSAGLMQPILIRPGKAGGYEIIAGERRWRAAQSIGLETIPAIVQDLDDETCAEWSLIENLQREDLNPLERAEAFQNLVDQYQLSHQNLADRLGMDRTSITNHLRLNELDDTCKEAIRDGRLSMGHAKVLLGITNIETRLSILSRALLEQWSVRRIEQEAREARDSSSTTPTNVESSKALANPHLDDLQRRLGDHLGTKVKLVTGRKKGSGKLIIEFFDLDHFESIMQSLQFPLDK